MIIKVNIAATDLWRLIASYKEGELMELGVMDIEAPPESMLLANVYGQSLFDKMREQQREQQMRELRGESPDRGDIQAS